MSQQKSIVEIKVDPGRLKGRRGILCGLLCAAVICTSLCLGLFTEKNNEVNSSVANGTGVCMTLFVSYTTPRTPPRSANPSVCHYVIGGSIIVLVSSLVLLIETLLAVFITFSFTE